MKYDVFISYSRKDTAIADQICAAFDKAGITYFIDRQGIGGGMEFPKALAPAIRESEVFLLLASQNAYDSAFTDREITFAFNKKRGEKMLPYIIDDAKFPEHLELIFSSNNWRQLKLHPIETVLINDILQLLGRVNSHNPNPNAYNPNPLPHQHDETLNSPKTHPSPVKGIKGTKRILDKRFGKYGIIDEYGNVILPFEYDDAGAHPNGFRMKKNNLWYIIDRDGNTMSSSESHQGSTPKQSSPNGKKRILDKRFGKYGIIDEYGNVIVPYEFDDAGVHPNGFRMKKNNTWYVFDNNGKVIG